MSLDLHGIITSWNKGAARMFGYPASEVIGQPVKVLFPADQVDEEPAILDKIKRGELVDHYDTVRRRKDGTLLDISLTVSPITDDAGIIIGASKVARDITELNRERERLRVTLSSIGDAVISTDASGRVMFMNASAEHLTAWRLTEAKGRSLDTVFTIVNELNRKPMDSRVAVVGEGRVDELANYAVLIGRDSQEHPVDGSAAPIRDRHNNLTGVVHVFRDVSHRRDAELTAMRLTAIIEGSDDAILSKTLDGIVTSWNPAAERIFGYAAEEVIGHSITKLFPQDRLDEEQLILARLQRGDRVDHFETVRIRKDGAPIDVSVTISPISNQDGQIVGASKIVRDVSQIKKVQAQLEARTVELETKFRDRTVKLQQTLAELEAFSYSLSHDMRAPLRAIQSFTEIVIEEHGNKIPEGVGFLRKVIGAANRMDRLIRGVLNFACVSRSDIMTTPVNLDQLVGDIILERPELQDANAEIEVVHPLASVLGHDASLTQCLTNLMDNAVKFVDPRVRPKVRIYTECEEGIVKICVSDNGIGIHPESQSRLFGIFERAGIGANYQGTGVGLAIVKKAAERMHGTVGVHSTPGLGSTFWVKLQKA